MLEPRRWLRAVVWTGGVQAAISAVSAAAVDHDGRIDPVALGGQAGLVLPVLVFLSIALPFVAYAADGQRVLIRYPRSSFCVWQLTGGLIGLSVSLAALHVFVLTHLGEDRGGLGDDVALIYLLVIPSFVIGALGATVGALFGLLFHLLFRWLPARRAGQDR